MTTPTEIPLGHPHRADAAALRGDFLRAAADIPALPPTKPRGHLPPAGPMPPLDRDLALRLAVANVLGWYRRDGWMPTEAVELVLADPVAADAALRAHPADSPLAALRRMRAEADR